MKKEIIRLWKEYKIWLEKSPYDVMKDFGYNFEDFMDWLDTYHID